MIGDAAGKRTSGGTPTHRLAYSLPGNTCLGYWARFGGSGTLLNAGPCERVV
jgi:hypothetical protein